jgi:mannose-6-phosphate isomerase-like protein (cupin superfamily)
MEDGMTFGKVDLDGNEQFQTLRRTLGVTSFGLNVISLRPRQRLRIHRHLRQEEVYIVLAGTLTLTIEANDHTLGVGDAARVAPAVKRQLANTGSDPCVLLALGGAGVHEGRDGEAFVSWDDLTGRPPQDVPLPPDLPA